MGIVSSNGWAGEKTGVVNVGYPRKVGCDFVRHQRVMHPPDASDEVVSALLRVEIALRIHGDRGVQGSDEVRKGIDPISHRVQCDHHSSLL